MYYCLCGLRLMTTRPTSPRLLTGAAATAALLLFLMLSPGMTPAARAQAVITFLESGGNVIANGTGAVDMSGLSELTRQPPFTSSAQVQPNVAGITMGQTGVGVVSLWTGVTGPSSFGPGAVLTAASSGSGNLFGTVGGTLIILPLPYSSLAPLSATNTYSGHTFASLGLTPGTYTWTKVSNGATVMTVQIGPAATAAPEPGTLALLGTAAVALLPLGAVVVRKRRPIIEKQKKRLT
jgi:hypothetical protein